MWPTGTSLATIPVTRDGLSLNTVASTEEVLDICLPTGLDLNLRVLACQNRNRNLWTLVSSGNDLASKLLVLGVFPSKWSDSCGSLGQPCLHLLSNLPSPLVIRLSPSLSP